MRFSYVSVATTRVKPFKISLNILSTATSFIVRIRSGDVQDFYCPVKRYYFRAVTKVNEWLPQRTANALAPSIKRNPDQ